MIPTLEGWPTKAKEAPSPYEVRLTPLDINPVFQCRRVQRLRQQLSLKTFFCLLIICILTSLVLFEPVVSMLTIC